MLKLIACGAILSSYIHEEYDIND